MRALILSVFVASVALAQSEIPQQNISSGASLTANQTFLGTNTFSATLSGAASTWSGTITSTVASGSNAIALTQGAKLQLGDATRSYLYQCQAGQDLVCVAQSFRIGGAIAAGNLYLSSGTKLTFEGTSAMEAPMSDSTGTPGSATINKLCGRSAIAAAGTTITITNSVVASANSNIQASMLDTDGTCFNIKYVAGTGSFVATCNAAATATTKFQWCVVNKSD